MSCFVTCTARGALAVTTIGERERALEQLGSGNDLVHEAQLARTVHVERVADAAQLERDRGRHSGRRARRAAGTDQPALHLRDRERRMIGGDRSVAREHELEPAADRGAVHRRDHGLRVAPGGEDLQAGHARRWQALVSGRLEVHPRGEGLVAGSGENYRAYPFVGFGIRERGADLADCPAVERVAPLGAVDLDHHRRSVPRNVHCHDPRSLLLVGTHTRRVAHGGVAGPRIPTPALGGRFVVVELRCGVFGEPQWTTDGRELGGYRHRGKGVCSMADYRYVTYEVLDEGRVARIMLNRVESRNAQNRGLLVELDAAFGRAEADDTVRVVILGGAGPIFSSGHDLGSKEPIAERTPGPDQDPTFATNGGTRKGAENRMLQEWHYFFENTKRWRNLRKITIAQVNGTVYAAGLMLMWACDLIVGADDARFADVVGTRLGMCGVEYFAHPWEFGPRKTKELMLTGDALDVEEAHRLGMVSKVFPADELAERTLSSRLGSRSCRR